MRAQVAVWALAAVALGCAVPGAVYASEVFHAYRVEPTSMGIVIADAMRATILLLLAGCAVVGLLVVRGVAEMLDQVLLAIDRAPAGDGTDELARQSPHH